VGVTALTLSSNGLLLMSADTDGVLKVWDWRNGFQLSSVNAPYGRIDHLIAHPNGRMALSIAESLDTGGKTFIWDMLPGNVTDMFTSNNPAVWDGETIFTSVCTDNCANSDLEQIDPSGAIKQLDKISGDTVSQLAFSPSDSRLWVGTNKGSVFAWNTLTGKLDGQLPSHDGGIQTLSLADDHLLVSSTGRNVEIWNTKTLTLEHSLSGTKSTVLDATLSPDGTMVASVNNVCDAALVCQNGFAVWSMVTGEVIHQWTSEQPQVSKIAFLQNNQRLIASVEDGTLQIWDIASGKLLQTLTGHSAQVTALAVSPDGKTALSGSCSDSCTHGEIIEWDLTNGEALRTFTGQGDLVNSLQYSPNGQSFISTSLDNSLYIWRLDSNAALLDWIHQNYNLSP